MEIKSIEVKKVKSCAGTDGLAWSCEVHVNGKRVADARDSGTGGEVLIYWHDRAWQAPLEAHAAAQPMLPAKPEWDLPAMPLTVGMLIGELCDKHDHDKRLKRLCRTNVVFAVQDDKPGSYRVLKGALTTETRRALVARHGDRVTFVNDRFAA